MSVPGNKPKYKLIANDLLHKIQSGDYPLHSLIPREVDLAQQYNVSRPTVRQAIQMLTNKGYLKRKKKHGTIVKQVKIEQEFTHIIESYSKEMNTKGISPKTAVLFFEEEAANEEVQHNLRLNSREAVFKLVRLRYANEQPIVIVTSYIPKGNIPELINHDLAHQSLYDTLEKHGLKVRHVIRKLEVIKADETTASLLNVNKNEPLFYFHTRGFTDEEKPIEYSIAKYRGDLNSFKIDVVR